MQIYKLEATKAELSNWYALEGGIRDQIGVKSKKHKDGRIQVKLFVKSGVTLTDAQCVIAIAKAVAVLKGN